MGTENMTPAPAIINAIRTTSFALNEIIILAAYKREQKTNQPQTCKRDNDRGNWDRVFRIFCGGFCISKRSQRWRRSKSWQTGIGGNNIELRGKRWVNGGSWRWNRSGRRLHDL